MTDGHRIDPALPVLTEAVSSLGLDAMDRTSLGWVPSSSSPSYCGVAAELDSSGVDSKRSWGSGASGSLLPVAERSGDRSESDISDVLAIGVGLRNGADGSGNCASNDRQQVAYDVMACRPRSSLARVGLVQSRNDRQGWLALKKTVNVEVSADCRSINDGGDGDGDVGCGGDGWMLLRGASPAGKVVRNPTQALSQQARQYSPAAASVQGSSAHWLDAGPAGAPTTDQEPPPGPGFQPQSGDPRANGPPPIRQLTVPDPSKKTVQFNNSGSRLLRIERASL